MISIDQHLRRILDAAAPLPTHERVLADALGAVLAEDLHTRWPVPLFDNSAMDGYAVRRDEALSGAVLRVVGDVPAGSGADPDFGPGEAVRIMTGAPVPSDADAIVPLEHTDLGIEVRDSAPDAITVLTQPAPGAHIRRRGEDAAAGDLVVGSGTALGPWQLSSIASAGHERVLVHRTPRVAIVSTGSELIRPGGTPSRGQIPESNSVLLAAAVRDAGAVVSAVHTVVDDPSALRAVLDGLDADVVILSGGASVGAFDVVKAVLGGERGIQFDSVAMQPGKPQGFGVDHEALVFCLPGNPVSVAVSFEMFVRPALRRLIGAADLARPRVTRTASTSWRCPPGRAQVVPVVIDELTARPATAGGSGSHLVSSLAMATAFAIIPADVDQVHEGDPVSVMVFS